MSRWLLSVGKILEHLDDQAEQAVEEHHQLHWEALSQATSDLYSSGGRDDGKAVTSDVATILATRGLQKEEEEEEEEKNVEEEIYEHDDDRNVIDIRVDNANPEPSTDDPFKGPAAEKEEDSIDNLRDFSEWNTSNNLLDGMMDETSIISVESLVLTAHSENVGIHREPHPFEIATGVSEKKTGTEASHVLQDKSKVSVLPQQSEENSGSSVTSEAVIVTDQFHSPIELTLAQDGRSVPSTSDLVTPGVTSNSDTVNSDQTLSNEELSSTQSYSRIPRMANPLAALSTSTAATLAVGALKTLSSKNNISSSNQSKESSEQRKSSSGPGASDLTSNAAELHKEIRTLGRHVISLNKQLESAEAEVEAQRNELERAAERMNKDAARNKVDREKERIRHEKELKALRESHDALVKEQQERFEAQVESVRVQLRSTEERRMQEGGDWNKELAEAVTREQEAIVKLVSVEDEKNTILSQVTMLLTQQEALESRVEYLSKAADNAFEREREAEDRLDKALSAHARQISHRQSRETELEQMIAEIGAALVARRSSIEGVDKSDDGNDLVKSDSIQELNFASQMSEIESMRLLLLDEQQRNSTLQKELNELTRERSEEVFLTQKRQIQHDRQVDELSLSLSRCKAELMTHKEAFSVDRLQDRLGNQDKDGNEKQIRSLSEEVLRQRDRFSQSQSEILALKSRLQTAIDRAQIAESIVQEANVHEYGDTSDDVEHGYGPIRRLGQPHYRSRRASNRGVGSATMRSVFKLDGFPKHGIWTEKIGITLDALDSFLTQSGKFLRRYPAARLLFIIYMLLIHIWTFIILIFHVHGIETVHGDFGALPPSRISIFNGYDAGKPIPLTTAQSLHALQLKNTTVSLHP